MGSHVKLRPPAPRLTKSASIIHCFSRTCQKPFDLDIASFTGLSTAWTHSTQHCNCPSLHKAPSKQKLIAPQRPPPATPTLQHTTKPQWHHCPPTRPRRRSPVLRGCSPDLKAMSKNRPRLPLLRLQPRRQLVPLTLEQRVRAAHRGRSGR